MPWGAALVAAIELASLRQYTMSLSCQLTCLLHSITLEGPMALDAALPRRAMHCVVAIATHAEQVARCPGRSARNDMQAL